MNIYSHLASTETILQTEKALKEKGYQVFIAENGKQALNQIKSLIPKGASIMNGASVTLEQIGFTDYLKSGNHPWNDLHAKINTEKDNAKKSKLRKEATLSDYYLGSVHALTKDGDFIIASNTGSQLPHVVFTSPNLIFIVSTKKIVANAAEGLDRLEKYVFPLENQHMQDLYKMGSNISKIVIFKKELGFLGRKIHFVLVNEDLGF